MFSFLTHTRPHVSLFPYTTLFRSTRISLIEARAARALRNKRAWRSAMGESSKTLFVGFDVHKDTIAEERLARLTHGRSEEHTSELQSLTNLVCRPLLEKKTILKHC